MISRSKDKFDLIQRKAGVAHRKAKGSEVTAAASDSESTDSVPTHKKARVGSSPPPHAEPAGETQAKRDFEDDLETVSKFFAFDEVAQSDQAEAIVWERLRSKVHIHLYCHSETYMYFIRQHVKLQILGRNSTAHTIR